MHTESEDDVLVWRIVLQCVCVCVCINTGVTCVHYVYLQAYHGQQARKILSDVTECQFVYLSDLSTQVK